jgi:hypothetical protein
MEEDIVARSLVAARLPGISSFALNMEEEYAVKNPAAARVL